MTEYEATLAHLKRMATLDSGYARWRAGTLAERYPKEYGELLRAINVWMREQNMPKTLPFDEWMATLK